MRNLAVCGKGFKNSVTVELDSVPLLFNLIHTEDIKFDPTLPENRFNVLVRKIAFSCNYRDKGLIFNALSKLGSDRFYIIGSEFVGEVIDIGSEVTDFQKGDRVIGNNTYPHSGAENIPPGVPTNHASKEYQVFHQVKLIKIPNEMPDEVAAAFSIGGQTTYSMLRKLNITEGSNVLVTAARSNTSLFAVNALQQYPVNVYAATTSYEFVDKLLAMGVKKVFDIRQSRQKEDVMNFDYIIDPFFDLHVGKLIGCLSIGGKYITCGFFNQYSHLINQEFQYQGLNLTEVLTVVMIKNLQIIGNCVGEKADLETAIQDYASGKFPVVIDSVFSGNQIQEFIERTYKSKDRFGKVVYRY